MSVRTSSLFALESVGFPDRNTQQYYGSVGAKTGMPSRWPSVKESRTRSFDRQSNRRGLQKMRHQWTCGLGLVERACSERRLAESLGWLLLSIIFFQMQLLTSDYRSSTSTAGPGSKSRIFAFHFRSLCAQT